MEFIVNKKIIFLLLCLPIFGLKPNDKDEQEELKELYNAHSVEVALVQPYSFSDMANQLDSYASLGAEYYHIALASLACTGVVAEVMIQSHIPRSQAKIRNLARIVAATALYSFGAYINSIAQQEDFTG